MAITPASTATTQEHIDQAWTEHDAPNRAKYYCLQCLNRLINSFDLFISSFVQFVRMKKVGKALKVAETILDESRSSSTGTQQHVLLENDDNHTWNDKYDLTEYITNMAIAAQINTLQHLFSLNNNNGTDTDTSHVLETMYDWVHEENKTAMLRFVFQGKCTFLGEEEVKTGVLESVVSFLDDVSTKESNYKKKISQIQKKYNWNVKVAYQILAKMIIMLMKQDLGV